MKKFLLVLLLLSLFAPAAHAKVEASKVIELTNKERVKAKLPPLKQDPRLMRSAMLKAQDMAKNKYFDHFSPKKIGPWYWFQKVKYIFRHAAENLAMGRYKDADVVRGWMQSAGHRKNILDKKNKQIGVAVVEGVIRGRRTTLVVQHLGAQ